MALLVALFAAPLYGAEPERPEISATYGPIAVQSLERRGEINFWRMTNDFETLTLIFEYSPDNQKSWVWYGESVYPGGGPVAAAIGSVKRLPTDVTATHIRVRTVVVGGTVKILKQPSVVKR